MLNLEFTGITSGTTTYSSWKEKTSNSDAVYAGNSAGGNNSIQLRSKNNNSGIISTASGGKVKKITVVWESHTTDNRTLNVYGKNTVYTSPTDLYNNDNQGTLIGTIVKGSSTELTVSDEYEYIGLRSASDAMYLTEIDIEWELASSSPTCTIDPTEYDFGTVGVGQQASTTFTVTTANLTGDLDVSLLLGEEYSVSPNTISSDATSTIVTATFSSNAVGTFEDMLVISGGGITEVGVDLTATAAWTVTASSNNDEWGTVVISDNSITATPNTGYTYAEPAYTVTPIGAATVEQVDNIFTVTPSANCNVQINFAESTTPVCTIDPTEYDFGTVGVGQEASTTFTVTTANLTGDLDVSLLLGEEYSVSPNTISSDATSTIVTVTFSSNAVGTFEDMLVISDGGITEVGVNLTATAAPVYTITFDPGSGTVTPASLSGVTINLSELTVSPPDGWNLFGWALEATDGATNSAPEIVSDPYTPTGNVTLYAVYMKEEEGAVFSSYEKVTSAPDDWSGKYLLSTGTYTATGGYSSNHLSIANFEPGTTEKTEYEFTLTKVGTTGYSILFPDGNYYLGYSSSTNFARSTTEPTSSTTAYLWTPGANDYTANVGTNARKIAAYGTTDFRPYSNPSSSTNAIVYLYKRTEIGITTYNSNPSLSTATPTFSPEAGEYNTTQYVTLSCSTEGATIYYTTDGSTPTTESNVFSSAIEVANPMTINAFAIKDGMVNSAVATATYTVPFTTIPAIFEKATAVGSTETDVKITFGNWLVSGVKGNNIAYVTDGTNGLVIYKDDHGFAVGDKLSGTVDCKVLKFGGSAELKNVSSSSVGLTIVSDQTVPVNSGLAIAELNGSHTGVVLNIGTLTYDGTNFSNGVNTITPDNNFNLDPDPTINLISGKKYTVEGMYLYSGKICPRNYSDFTIIPAVETPTFSPGGGTYDDAQNVTITCTTDDAIIYYTTDGSTPTTESTPYSVAIDIISTQTIKAIAVKDGMNDSDIATATYTITSSKFTVTFDAGNGTCATASITQETPGETIILPTCTPLLEDASWSFIGWSETNLGSGTTESISPLIGTYTPENDITLYAVYSRTYTTQVFEHNFADMDNFSSWNTNYQQHTTTFSDGVYVELASANKQTSTITDMPVTKGNDVIVKAPAEKTISALTFVCQQWGTKKQTITLNTSTDEGGNYYDTDITSSNFTLSTSSLASDVNAVKFTFSSKNDQIGLKSISLTCNASTTVYATSPTDFNIPSGDQILPNDFNLDTEGITLTIGSGSIVTASGLTNTDPANLIIEDGGQLIINNAGVQATVMKNFLEHGTYNKGDATGWYFISSPVKDQAIQDFVENATDGDYDLYKWVGSNKDEDVYKPWYNYKQHHYPNNFETSFQTGIGYLAGYESSDEFPFKGELNYGDAYDFTPNLTYNGNIWECYALLGNPYSYALDWANFSTKNNVYDGFAVLDPEIRAYQYRSGSATINPCRGFFVKTTGNNPELRYNKGARQRTQIDQIDVVVSSQNGIDNAIIRLEDESKGGFTKLENFNSENPMLWLPVNDKEYAIASYSEGTVMVPVNFKAGTTAKYTIRMKATGQYSYLHLIDRLTGDDIDMLIEGEYSFIGSPRDNAERFIVKFNNNNSDTPENDIFAYQNGDELFVTGNGTIQVFDVTGRFVQSKEVHGNTSMSISSLPKGVYIFRLIGSEIKTQKIVVR